MNILIAYAGKTGTTEKCAGILGQKLKNVTIVNLVHETPDIYKYDLTIVGGSIRGGRLHSKAREFIKKNKQGLLTKKAAYYICCCLVEGYEKYFEDNIDKDLLENSLIYNSFGGEIDITKQKGIGKIIVKLINKAIEDGKMESQNKILHENIEEFVNKIENVR